MKKPVYVGLSLALSTVVWSEFALAQAAASPTTPAAAAAAPSQPKVEQTPNPSGAAAGTTPNATSPNGTAPTGTEAAASTTATAPPGTEAVAGSADVNAPTAATATPSDDKAGKGKKKRKKRDKDGQDDQDKAKTDKDQDDQDDQRDHGDLGDYEDRGTKASKGDKKLPWEASPKIQVGGLLHSQFSINDAPGTPNNEFRLTAARVYLEWRQGSLLDAVGEIELSRDSERNNIDSWAPMRDAYARVSIDPMLHLRMGQFKRPFGKLSLTPLRELKLIRRGISDVWVNEELGYGERDVGFQVDGRIGRGVELRYALGVFNGNGRNRREDDPNGAKDFVGRLEGRLGKHVSIGIDSANKRFDQAEHPSRPKSAWMSGADLLVEYAGLYALIEGQIGSNYQSTAQNHTGSLLALVAYKIPITEFWQIAVEPLVKGEFLKAETEIKDRRTLNGTAGANLYVGKIFRLMVQGEWIDTKGPLPEHLGEAASEKRLIVQAGMYTR